MQILGKVDYHSDITTLSRQAGATSPPGDRRPMEATNSYGINNILLVSWNYDSNRNLSIVGAVRCIERFAAGIEADLAANSCSQLFGKKR